MNPALDPLSGRPWHWRWSDLPIRVKGLLVVTGPLGVLLVTAVAVQAMPDADPSALRGLWDIGATIWAVTSVLAMLGFTASVARRVDCVIENARGLAERLPLTPLPPADDEVGRMATHLQRAANTLDQQAREQSAAAAALREYAERTYDLYDHAPCGYHSLDAVGRFIAINQTELDWLGYTRDEVIGRLTFADVVTPASRERFTTTFPLLQQTGAIRDVEFDLEARDGRVLPVSVSATALRDADGAFVATRSSVFDIRQRKAAEEALRGSEARLSAILQTVAEGLLIVSADGEMSYWNPAAERLLGLSSQAVAGQRLTLDHWQVRDAAGQPLPFERWPVTRVLNTGEEIAGEQIRVTRADGSDITLSISVAPLREAEGRVTGVVASFQDVTERRLAAEALALAKAEAERANQAKSEFLSRMSHDLRTPLNAMLGFAQLLEAEADGEGRREEIGQILRGGSHLLGLINEVLDISRIEAGELSLSSEPLAVAELLEHALSLVRPMADQQNVTLVGLGDRLGHTHVLADKQRCHQVLLNLLSNAVKYNRPGGRVTVSAVESHPGHLRIAVMDTGAGIRPEKLASMFRPFERLGAEQTSIEGTGLGLALSKGLVEAMGGTIGVESVVDQGTTLWVEFPLTEPPLQAVAGQSAHSAIALDPFVRGEVLYIEDNTPNVRLMERLLAKRPGVRMRAVAQGRLGLEQVLARRPDLVLLDLHLPDVPGEEVLRRLWENPETRSLPVAVLSADATPLQVRRLKEAGAIAYLTKPLDLAAVLHVIDETLKRASTSGADPRGDQVGV